MPQRNQSRVLAGFWRQLYEGTNKRAVRFRYALLLFDVVTLVYLVATSFVEGSPALEMVDALIGFIVLAEFVCRLSASRNRLRDLVHPLGLADLAVIASFLAPISGQELGFLRVLRALRLFRSYRVATRMRQDSSFVRRHYDTIVAGTHLFVFLFLMTAIVYQTQYTHNPAISNTLMLSILP
jgi:voltage-gated potassium channel